ncbi:hypothetical protein [uncultured Phenylobacterium sp.]|uniref:hypothetical protein n=1 Tax=uncultured Phenylobacterium sp. TaxID=349273 RepID=UPI0025DD9629|nr:hypothetical protein [uncultured Phenylobacterium sp.]
MPKKPNHTVNILPPREQIERELADRRRRITELQSKIDTAPVAELISSGDTWAAGIRAIEDGVPGGAVYQEFSIAELKARKVRIEAGLPETDAPAAPPASKPHSLRFPIEIGPAPQDITGDPAKDPIATAAWEWVRERLRAASPKLRVACAYTQDTHFGLVSALILLKTSNDRLQERLKRLEDRAAEAFIDDIQVEQPGLRTMVLSFTRGEVARRFELSLGGFVDRGVHKDGEAYELGDAVTFGGQLWIAQGPTTEKPGGNDAWRLAVRKGRDGKDAPQTPPKNQTIRYA